MMTPEAFCAEFGIDPAAARPALARATDAAPWYAEALLGAGGWFSAIAIIVFVVAFFSLVVGIDEPGIEAIVAGLALFGGAVAWRRRQRDGLFARHFAIALAAAGATLAVGGLGAETDSVWAAAIAGIVLAAAGTLAARDGLLQFLLAGLPLVLVIVGLEKDLGFAAIDTIALFAPIGLWLYLYPPRLDLRPTATLLLLAMPFAATILETPALSWTSSKGWFARVVLLIAFAAMIVLRNRAGTRLSPTLVAAALLAALVALLLPAGAAGALLLMMLAYTLGHRPFAAIGAALAVWFIWQFYFELGLDLLSKSVLLIAVGLGCLLLYALLARRGAAT